MGQVIVPLIVGFAASKLSQLLLGEEDDNPYKDPKPTTLAKRGAFVDYIMGRRRTGVVFLSSLDPIPVGQGNFRGRGWHGLCVGPQRFGRNRLVRVREDNKDLFTALNGGANYTHTGISWVTLPLGNEQNCVFHPGSWNSNVNAQLQAFTTGIPSSWPYFCHALILNKFLEFGATWPLMDYEVRQELPNRAQYISIGKTGLTQGQPNLMSIRDIDDTAPVHNVSQMLLSGGLSGVNSEVVVEIDISGNVTSFYSDGDTVIASSPVDQDIDGRGFDIHTVTFSAGSTRLRCTTDLEFFIKGGISTTELIDTTGLTIQKTLPGSDGVNPAHAIYQLLFAPYPHGLNQDEEDFDIAGLNEFSTFCENEHLAFNIRASEGESLIGVLAAIMQDAGIFITLEGEKWTFKPLRESTEVVEIPKSLIVPTLPEIGKKHGTKETNFRIFEYNDRSLNFRPQTINLDDDGESERVGYNRPDVITLRSVTDKGVAEQVATRRENEAEIDETSAITVDLLRGASDLTPGTTIKLPDEIARGRYRIVDVTPRQLSGGVTISAKRDVYAYATQASPLFVSQATTVNPSVDPDAAVKIWELPFWLRESGAKYAVLPIKGSDSTINSDLYLSSTGNEFYFKQKLESFVDGGSLRTEIQETSKSVIAEIGVDLLGPGLQDFFCCSGLSREWRSGRQMMLIDEELFFVEDVEYLSPSSVVFKNCIRARFGTHRRAHDQGAEVYIFNRENIITLNDAVFSPDATIFFKTTPRNRRSVLNLAEVTARSFVPLSREERPSEILNLRCQSTNGHPNSYSTGDDINFKWSIFARTLRHTGSGLVDAQGQPIRKRPPIEKFNLKVRFGSTVGREVENIEVTEYTYTNANLVSDFGIEPAYFHIDLIAHYGAFESETQSIKIQKV